MMPMRTMPRSRVWSSLFALGMTAAALAARWVLHPWLADDLPWVTLPAAVAATVWYAGYGPALLATVLGYVGCRYLFVGGPGSLAFDGAPDLFGSLAYLVFCLVIIGFGESVRRARVRADRDIRKRGLMERALQRNERDLTDLFENAVVGLHWVGPNGIILRANQAESNRLGYSRDEYVGHHIAEFHVDQSAIADLLTRLIAGDTLREWPAQMRCKDGAIRDVLISSHGLFEDGVFVHSRCSTVDVTDQKRAEEAQRLFAAIVETSDDAIVSKTLDGVILSWNQGAERLFGHTAADAVGQSIGLIIPPELQAEERAILDRLRRGERIEHFETVRVTKDGRRLDMSLTVSPVRDTTGRIIGASKIARDITDRKRDQEALRESEARFRIIADSAPVPIWLENASGGLFVNQAYLDFLGLDYQADMDGYDWLRYVHTEDRDAYLTTYLDCRSRRARFTAEFRFRRYDGQYRWMRSIGVPRITGAGALLGYTGCTFDIHEARMAATQLREAARLKDEFLATLAHELRNPLGPLRNSLEILKRAEGDADLLRSARDTMERQLTHMVRLVDDLLDVSRITRGQLELRTARIELESIVHQAVEICSPLAERGHQQIVLALPEGPTYLDADPVRLAQVFSNLLDNACKYAPPGSTVRLTGERRGSDVFVSVKDTGIGIPAEKLERIFDMFAQVDPTLEGSHGGLGIGLTLVKRLVELHGGSITARSEGAGLGSEFVVRLPVLVEKRRHQELPAAVTLAPPTVPLRVLVVDDNKDSAESLAMLLRMSDHDTRLAYDGREAVEAADTFRPDAILLDIGLPKLNGLEACRRIREQPWGRNMVIVALTGWGQDDDRLRSSSAGFDGHLVKPVDYDGLVHLLQSLLAQ